MAKFTKNLQAQAISLASVLGGTMAGNFILNQFSDGGPIFPAIGAAGGLALSASVKDNMTQDVGLGIATISGLSLVNSLTGDFLSGPGKTMGRAGRGLMKDFVRNKHLSGRSLAGGSDVEKLLSGKRLSGNRFLNSAGRGVAGGKKGIAAPTQQSSKADVNKLLS